jgi:hypothetical protein
MSLMMMKTNPITPPPELVQQWYQEADSQLRPYYVYIAIRAAQWGADQELEACCEWLPPWRGNDLRKHRRPKPPSLKEQALAVAAQAVLDAFLDTPGEVPMPMWDYGRDLAAALRALAVRINGADAIRQDVLDIADELENQ